MFPSRGKELDHQRARHYSTQRAAGHDGRCRKETSRIPTSPILDHYSTSWTWRVAEFLSHVI
jgi:hypothetical protein